MYFLIALAIIISSYVFVFGVLPAIRKTTTPVDEKSVHVLSDIELRNRIGKKNRQEPRLRRLDIISLANAGQLQPWVIASGLMENPDALWKETRRRVDAARH